MFNEILQSFRRLTLRDASGTDQEVRARDITTLPDPDVRSDTSTGQGSDPPGADAQFLTYLNQFTPEGTSNGMPFTVGELGIGLTSIPQRFGELNVARGQNAAVPPALDTHDPHGNLSTAQGWPQERLWMGNSGHSAGGQDDIAQGAMHHDHLNFATAPTREIHHPHWNLNITQGLPEQQLQIGSSGPHEGSQNGIAQAAIHYDNPNHAATPAPEIHNNHERLTAEGLPEHSLWMGNSGHGEGGQTGIHQGATHDGNPANDGDRVYEDMVSSWVNLS
jgi:hypothetical protein